MADSSRERTYGHISGGARLVEQSGLFLVGEDQTLLDAVIQLRLQTSIRFCRLIHHFWSTRIVQVSLVWAGVIATAGVFSRSQTSRCPCFMPNLIRSNSTLCVVPEEFQPMVGATLEGVVTVVSVSASSCPSVAAQVPDSVTASAGSASAESAAFRFSAGVF